MYNFPMKIKIIFILLTVKIILMKEKGKVEDERKKVNYNTCEGHNGCEMSKLRNDTCTNKN